MRLTRTGTVRGPRRDAVALQTSEAHEASLLRLTDTLRPVADPAEGQAMACRVLGEQLPADRVNYAEIEGEEYGTVQGSTHFPN